MFERITPRTQPQPELQVKDLSMKQTFIAAFLVVFALLALYGGYRAIDYHFTYLEVEHELSIFEQQSERRAMEHQLRVEELRMRK
jgi:hypothetical protein